MFYKKINKKEYNVKILRHTINYTNIIAIKNVIIYKKTREKKRQLVVANPIKLGVIPKIIKLIDLKSKYFWTITNINIDIEKNLELIDLVL